MADSLDTCPWQHMQIEGQVFLAKCFRNASSCELLVSDCNTCWYEKLSESNVMEKNSRLNPNIEASYDRLLNHVVNIFKKIDSKTSLSIVANDDNELRITSESFLSSLAFTWEFNLVTRVNDTVSNQLTTPLISIIIELFRRQQELFKIIENKDAQIADYKAEGVKLHRRHRDEERFDGKVFEAEMAKHDKFHGLLGISNEETCFQTLYTAVMRRKRENDVIGLLQSSKTVENSVVNSKAELSEVVSPVKREASTEKCDQDEELERRQALENRLSKERTKKETQRKKKKLKL